MRNKKNYWFFSRKRLFMPIFCEYSLFYILFFIFQINLDSNFLENLTFSFLIINTWIFIGYIIGRYHIRSLNLFIISKKILIKSLFINIIYLLISIFLIKFHYFKNENIQTFFKLFLIFNGLSLISQTIISKYFYKFFKSENIYLYFGKIEKYKILQKEIGMSEFTLKIIFSNSNLDLNQYEIKFDGIILDEQINFSDSSLKKLLEYKSTGIPIHSLISWCNRFLKRFPPELITNLDLINEDLVYQQNLFHKRMKRAFDIFFSILLLLTLLPLLIVTGIFIYLNDRGPIFFSQTRTGLRGKEFNILKFRTMKINAESSGPQWAKKNDSRITFLGKYLRLFRIDELPQLIHVFKGSMTLIGPRPERPEFDILLKEKVPHYSLRYLVKPGLSGWAQVNYPYGASVKDAENKLSFDLYYLKNTSIKLDLLIFFKTIRLISNKMLSEPNS